MNSVENKDLQAFKKKNSKIIKDILSHLGDKKAITFEDLSIFLSGDMLESENIDYIYGVLEHEGISLINEKMETDICDIDEFDEASKLDSQCMMIDDSVHSDDDVDDKLDEFDDEILDKEDFSSGYIKSGLLKDSNSEDPIRLYLKEIGKEFLLTGNQEVELAKQMDSGESIIENILKNEGLVIENYYNLVDAIYSRVDKEEFFKKDKEREKDNSFDYYNKKKGSLLFIKLH
ncbi:RNA polymerase sigma factor rpoD [Borrelia coriaceae ATCC 43381]|uniref:RNA polymerase sigma factor rpoD n=1 Tax=Borrelia coriaceae ATCC 43381 TaxID=1408429 RepID=W5SVG1_9SPIR|nr:RNA polymerase sigma factor rpoD [Borrelia coriaceae ATCC 43381]